jgi:poly(A) polymerase
MTHLPHMPWMGWPETRDVLSAFAAASVECRFVGGCVRDALLGFPVSDVDIATPCPPEAVMYLLKKANIKAIPTGLKHGTVTAVIGEKHFEITTLRKDVSTDGRHAEVAFTDDWKEDAQRRDFTMNALYADANGTITDYFNGIADAQNGVVRFIGDAQTRIREDVLRILRFYRFSAKYAKAAFDTQGHAACGALASLIDSLSGERIQTEMFKLLPQPRSFDALLSMQENGVLRTLFNTEIMLSHFLTAKSLGTRYPNAQDGLFLFGVLVASTASPSDTHRYISPRWKLSNADSKRLATFAEPVLQALPGEKESKQMIRAEGARAFADRCLLYTVFLEKEISELSTLMALSSSWHPPAFPVTGDDLIAAGYTSGPSLGAELKRLETLWEESEYALSKENLLKQ